MKCIAFILSLTILFLAVEPGISELVSQSAHEHSCCGGIPVKDDASPSAEKGCGQNACNPFFKCRSCSIVFVSINNVYSFSPLSVSDKLIIKPVFPHFHFTPDFWQPPKSV